MPFLHSSFLFFLKGIHTHTHRQTEEKWVVHAIKEEEEEEAAEEEEKEEAAAQARGGRGRETRG